MKHTPCSWHVLQSIARSMWYSSWQWGPRFKYGLCILCNKRLSTMESSLMSAMTATRTLFNPMWYPHWRWVMLNCTCHPTLQYLMTRASERDIQNNRHYNSSILLILALAKTCQWYFGHCCLKHIDVNHDVAINNIVTFQHTNTQLIGHATLEFATTSDFGRSKSNFCTTTSFATSSRGRIF